MKLIKSSLPILAAGLLVLTMSSFGVLSAVVNPAKTSNALATVAKTECAEFSWIEVPGKIPAMPPSVNGSSDAMSLDAFLNMTPATYKQMTGKKLGWFKSMELKMVQKQLKKQTAKQGDLPQWAYIVLSILALGWLAIGIRSDWKGNDWWIALLLYFLFIIPGIVYSLIVMKKYY